MTYIGMYDKEKGTVKTPENTWDISDKTVVSITDSYTDFEKSVFDGLQLAFKITANSLYGQRVLKQVIYITRKLPPQPPQLEEKD